MNSSPPLRRQIVVAGILLALVALIAYVGSQASINNIDGWYSDATKVPWNPPNWIFGPAWTTLYLGIAISGWLTWRSEYREDKPNAAQTPLRLFVLHMVLNAVWTPVFFAGYPLIGAVAWWIALGIILTLSAVVVWYAIATFPRSQAAAWIMLPYVMWLLFATTLNIGIIALN